MNILGKGLRNAEELVKRKSPMTLKILNPPEACGHIVALYCRPAPDLQMRGKPSHLVKCSSV